MEQIPLKRVSKMVCLHATKVDNIPTSLVQNPSSHPHLGSLYI